MERLQLERLLATRLRRRGFVISAGALTGLVIASQWSNSRVVAQPKFSDYPFKLGVASGDPLPDSVVLWTRLAPNPLTGNGGMPSVNIPVQWKLATDPNMKNVVLQGTAVATPELAHSIRVVPGGLQPATWYWYQFKAGNEVSPIGRTRTAPALGAHLQQLKFAFVSCQHWEHGYYTAYENLAKEDLDVVFHLGDYIYEGSPDPGVIRQHANPEPIDLDGYRIRYGQYKSDPDLQAAHAAFPWIVTWDDHEVENDYADEHSENFDPAEEFLKRRAAAYRAYYEHMPLRQLSMPQGANMQLYRRFTFGDLAEFSVLDTRQYRSDQACDDNVKGGGQLVLADECPELFNPNRTMLGATQRRWLLNGLAQSSTRWNVIAQQYLMAELEQQPGPVVGYWTDGWDGYFAERTRILEFIEKRKVSNPVVIGGDIHSFWVTDLKANFLDPNSPIVASEFVGTSITSSGVPYEAFAAFLPENPHIKFFESRRRGYVRCTVNPQQWNSDLRVVSTVEQPNATVSTLASYIVENGKPGPQRL